MYIDLYEIVGEPLPTATYMGFQIGPSRRARNGCRGNGRIRGTTLFFRVSREEEDDSFKGVQRKRQRERERVIGLQIEDSRARF